MHRQMVNMYMWNNINWTQTQAAKRCCCRYCFCVQKLIINNAAATCSYCPISSFCMPSQCQNTVIVLIRAEHFFLPFFLFSLLISSTLNDCREFFFVIFILPAINDISVSIFFHSGSWKNFLSPLCIFTIYVYIYIGIQYSQKWKKKLHALVHMCTSAFQLNSFFLIFALFRNLFPYLWHTLFELLLLYDFASSTDFFCSLFLYRHWSLCRHGTHARDNLTNWVRMVQSFCDFFCQSAFTIIFAHSMQRKHTKKKEKKKKKKKTYRYTVILSQPNCCHISLSHSHSQRQYFSVPFFSIHILLIHIIITYFRYFFLHFSTLSLFRENFLHSDDSFGLSVSSFI